MAVFAGSWSLDGAERVLGLVRQLGGCQGESASADAEHPDPGLLDLMASLVEKSLVQSVGAADGEPRFTMLATIREFALERLEAHGEADLVGRAHALTYLAFIEQARPHLRARDSVPWLRRIDAEHDNLRTAMDWGTAHADAVISETGFASRGGSPSALTGIDLASRIALASVFFWSLRSHLRQAREWTAHLLERATPGTAAQARLLTVNLALTMLTGDVAAVRVAAEATHGAWHALGDRYQAALALARLAHAEASMGDPARTAQLIRPLEAISEDRRYAADLEQPPLLYRASVARRMGDFDAASQFCEQALAMGREDGDLHTIQTALRFLGIIAAQQGDHERASRLFAQALAVENELGDYYCMLGTLTWVAYEAIEFGNPACAARLLGLLARVWDESGHRVIGLVGVEVAIERARGLLGASAFESAWAEGRAMTLKQAIAYAREGPERA